MRTKVFLRKAMRRLPLAGTAIAAAFVLHACTDAEAQDQPDPAEVQLFLDRLEREKQLASGEAERRDGTGKRIRELVEDAAKRTPSTATINRLEKVVVGRLSA